MRRDHSPSRNPGRIPRRVVPILLGALCAGLLAAAQPLPPGATAGVPDSPALHAQTVAVTASGDRVPLDADGLRRLRPGTRALDDVAARRQLEWLAAGRVPGAGTRWEAMVREALLDLDVLVLDDGAALAGWTPHWRYVWPRDASFVAAALARSGHPDDAERVLAHLQRVQRARPPGTPAYPARFLPDGSGGVPDDRPAEADGAGWVLWAAAELAASGPVDRSADETTDETADQTADQTAEETRARLRRLAPLLVTATTEALAEVEAGGGLPRPGLDYWEIPDRRVSLGLAAPLLAGLEAAPALLDAVGDAAPPGLADRARRAAPALDARIRRDFGAAGYPRYAAPPSGRSRWSRPARRDAAVTFLLPPFRTAPGSGPDDGGIDDDALWAAWTAAQVELRRPAGGLAPGAGWRADGISWTPETALFALTAASSGRDEQAAAWLDWLQAHRTAAGALPEKVLADGEPASVAPLAWTAALVVLTAAALEETGAGSGAGAAPPTPG